MNYQRNESQLKVETHMLEEKSFCSGAAFVPKQGGLEEDDGWAITFVHNEDTNISQVIKSIYVYNVTSLSLRC